MKKLILTAAVAIAAIANVNAEGNATSTNTMQIVVPQILSITAVPNYQAVYLTESDMSGTGEKTLTPVQYNIKSNAAWHVSATFATSATYLNNPSTGQQTSSMQKFMDNMSFSYDGSTWANLTSIGTSSFTLPGGTSNFDHTAPTGQPFTLNAKLASMGFDALPGTYTTTLTVTVTQP